MVTDWCGTALRRLCCCCQVFDGPAPETINGRASMLGEPPQAWVKGDVMLVCICYNAGRLAWTYTRARKHGS